MPMRNCWKQCVSLPPFPSCRSTWHVNGNFRLYTRCGYGRAVVISASLLPHWCTMSLWPHETHETSIRCRGCCWTIGPGNRNGRRAFRFFFRSVSHNHTSGIVSIPRSSGLRLSFFSQVFGVCPGPPVVAAAGGGGDVRTHLPLRPAFSLPRPPGSPRAAARDRPRTVRPAFRPAPTRPARACSIRPRRTRQAAARGSRGSWCIRG